MIRQAQIKLIANHTFKSIIKSPLNKWILGVFIILIVISISSSFIINLQHHHDVEHYSNDVRDRWENSPDKHPHRMAHYGYVAFRSKTSLSFFDRGLDSYLGNVVFLEAHRQNSVNFSTAIQSSSLLRFGELSVGLLLQLLLPLLIFFWGFTTISDDRTKDILKLYLTQGVSWTELLIGKSMGLFNVSMILTIPALLVSILLVFLVPQPQPLSHSIIPICGLAICYIIYMLIMSMLAVWVSSISKSSQSALTVLIGFWLLFVLIVPKLAQVTAQTMIPSPSKVEFDEVVEYKLLQQGDSHNPDDPHFKEIQDSLLLLYEVSSIKDLPFNYSGFIMKEGEKISTEIFRKQQAELINIYEQQSNVVNAMAIINPYLALKNVSMIFSGTDFNSYQIFKNKAENYRYDLAQTMNNLQIKHISNNSTSSADKKAILSQQYWKDFPPFHHRFMTSGEMINASIYAIAALLFWLSLLLFMTFFMTKNLKAL